MEWIVDDWPRSSCCNALLQPVGDGLVCMNCGRRESVL